MSSTSMYQKVDRCVDTPAVLGMFNRTALDVHQVVPQVHDAWEGLMWQLHYCVPKAGISK